MEGWNFKGKPLASEGLNTSSSTLSLLQNTTTTLPKWVFCKREGGIRLAFQSSAMECVIWLKDDGWVQAGKRLIFHEMFNAFFHSAKKTVVCLSVLWFCRMFESEPSHKTLVSLGPRSQYLKPQFEASLQTTNCVDCGFHHVWIHWPSAHNCKP